MACSPQTEFPDTREGPQIHFGQGGGITGFASHYVLLYDGRIFEKPARDTAYVFREKWDAKFAAQMFKNYDVLGLGAIDHYKPGNLYYFIEYREKDNTIHRHSWGQPGPPPEEELINFYNLLQKSLTPSNQLIKPKP
jgi:hypothetical protein